MLFRKFQHILLLRTYVIETNFFLDEKFPKKLRKSAVLRSVLLSKFIQIKLLTKIFMTKLRKNAVL